MKKGSTRSVDLLVYTSSLQTRVSHSQFPESLMPTLPRVHGMGKDDSIHLDQEVGRAPPLSSRRHWAANSTPQTRHASINSIIEDVLNQNRTPSLIGWNKANEYAHYLRTGHLEPYPEVYGSLSRDHGPPGNSDNRVSGAGWAPSTSWKKFMLLHTLITGAIGALSIAFILQLLFFLNSSQESKPLSSKLSHVSQTAREVLLEVEQTKQADWESRLNSLVAQLAARCSNEGKAVGSVPCGADTKIIGDNLQKVVSEAVLGNVDQHESNRLLPDTANSHIKLERYLDDEPETKRKRFDEETSASELESLQSRAMDQSDTRMNYASPEHGAKIIWFLVNEDMHTRSLWARLFTHFGPTLRNDPYNALVSNSHKQWACSLDHCSFALLAHPVVPQTLEIEMAKDSPPIQDISLCLNPEDYSQLTVFQDPLFRCQIPLLSHSSHTKSLDTFVNVDALWRREGSKMILNVPDWFYHLGTRVKGIYLEFKASNGARILQVRVYGSPNRLVMTTADRNRFLKERLENPSILGEELSTSPS